VKPSYGWRLSFWVAAIWRFMGMVLSADGILCICLSWPHGKAFSVLGSMSQVACGSHGKGQSLRQHVSSGMWAAAIPKRDGGA
jgi:hypothetical protein